MRGAATAVAAALLVLAAEAAPASGEPRVIDILDTPAELRLDTAWEPIALPPGTVDPPAGAWRHPAGATLVVTRTPSPNGDAWKKKLREAFVDEVVAGTRGTAPGYRERARRIRDIGGAPALELSFRRTVDRRTEVIVMRFLFFRTHTTTAAIAVPEARWNGARAIVEAAIAGLGTEPTWKP